VLQLQPDEGIALEMAVKQPGPLVETVPARLHFSYAEQFDLGHRTGYETLLYDVLIGEQTLFQRADQIEGGWRAVQPLIDAWRKGKPEEYAAGSAGPHGADALIARDGRAWNPIA
jgi:glucose-6-phosphate 1-dehydrogenase